MNRTIERRPVDPLKARKLAEYLGCEVLGRVYAARDAEVADISYDLTGLLRPAGLKDIDRAVGLLMTAVTEGRQVTFVGDFDADGATSTAVGVRALRAMGASAVSYLVPNRFEFGYGLTPEIVALATERNPWLLVTVDNGISAHAGVAAAQAAGIRVLVTDHHLPGVDLPSADAIVNPNQPDDEFASKHLAGVGVIFYVMLALRAALREANWFAVKSMAEPNLAALLPLVALGTVADVARLDYNNRLLVAQGLERINAGALQPGIAALLRLGKRPLGQISARELGFVAAPRLNAAGRLADMSVGIECLLTDDPEQASRLAAQLDALNAQRRSIEAGMQERALDMLDALVGLEQQAGVCVYDENWHPGVVGILAGRLKDRLRRPVIAFAPASGDEIKGSARSIAGIHVRDAIETVATNKPGLVRKFGGHAMAAGLTVGRREFDRFVAAFDAEVARRLALGQITDLCLSDGPISGATGTLELVERLRRGGPWGPGFPEPLFDDWFEVRGGRIVGERHLKLQLQGVVDGRRWDAIKFNHDTGVPRAGERIRAAFQLRNNDFRGTPSVEMELQEFFAD